MGKKETNDSENSDQMLSTLGYIGVALGLAMVYKLLFPSNSRSRYKKYRQPPKNAYPNFTGVERVISPDGEQEIKLSETGFSADFKPTTFPKMIQEAVRRHGSATAFNYEVKEGGTYVEKTITWLQYYQKARAMAKGMIAAGLNRFESINIIGFNSPEWIMSDISAMLCGVVPAGVYTTSNPGACAYIANHSKAKILLVESWKYLERYAEVADTLQTLRLAVLWGDKVGDRKKIGNMRVITLDQFIDEGKGVADSTLDERMNAVKPGHCSALIYTSGTTGNPKAVMMSHDSLIYDGATMMHTSKMAGISMDVMENRMVSYLPLNHAAAKIADIVLPLVATSTTDYPGCIYVARPDALKGTLVETMKRCQPTLFFGVPRVWEKMHEKMMHIKKPFPMNVISDYGKSLGRQWYNGLLNDGDGSVPLLWPLFDATLFAIVRKKLGLSKAKICATGAAPVQWKTLEYFGSLGIPIINVYGMSESSGAATVNMMNNMGRMSAGFPMAGIEIKIDHDPNRDKPGNGEILIGGRCNMMGYMHNREKTAGTIDGDGYIHSGDVGKLENGCLYITGRIKELIIGAGGENIAPVPIEHYIKEICPALSNVIMIGDHRKYNVCLVSLKTFVDPETMVPTSKLVGAAKEVSAASKTVEEAMKDPVWQKYIEDGIKQYNTNPKVCVSRASTIKKFRILPEDLSVPKETLGPTLKVKRPVVTKVYHDLIETMYS